MIPTCPATVHLAAERVRAGVRRGFYAGYGTTVLREIPFSVIQFPLYEINKRAVSRWKGGAAPSPFEAALCGSAAGGIAAALTTPVDVVKTRLMLGADAQGVPYRGTVATFRRVHAEGGARALFAGVVPRTGWICVGGAVFFGVYEQARAYYQQALAEALADAVEVWLVGQ